MEATPANDPEDVDENAAPKEVAPESGVSNRRLERDLDGGWAWVVLTATFVAFFIMQGQVFTSNIYFLIYLGEFGQPRSVTAMLGAAYTAAINLSGPVASVLLRRFGPRMVLMSGGFFIALGFLLTNPATTMVHVIVASGVVRGIGGGFVMCACQAALAAYFEKRLYAATGIMYTSSPIGMMTVGLLTEYVIVRFGWRGSLLVQAGLALQICACGAAVYRRPEATSVAAAAANGEAAARRRRIPWRRYASDPRFWCLSACTTLFFMFTAVVVMFWKDILPRKEHFKIAVVAMAAGSTLGRATAGIISARVPPPIHNAVVALVGAAAIPVFLVSDRVWIVAVQNLVWGFCNGQQTVADRLQLAWVYGRFEMPIVLGYSLVFVGIGGFLAPPIAGMITDATGDYTVTLFMTSSFLVVGAAMSVTLYFIHKKRSNPSTGTKNDEDVVNGVAVELQKLSSRP